MASEAELADLFITLRAVNAPILEGFAQTAVAGEDMVTALNAGFTELDASIARTAESLAALRDDMAATGTSAAGLDVGAGAGAASAGAGDAAVGSASAAAASAAGVDAAVTEETAVVNTATAEQVAAWDRVLAIMSEVGTEAATVTAEISGGMGLLAESMATQADGMVAVQAKVKAGWADVSTAETAAATKQADASALSVAGIGKIGLAVGALGVASIDLGTKFQTQMTRLYTAAGAPKQAVLDNSNAILAMGTSVGQTGTAMAEALYHPISAGLDLATSLQVVKNAAEEAQISGASLDDTTYSLSSVMKAFNLPVAQTEQTMSSLNAIVGEGDMRFQDFNQSVKNWAPTAAQMGISINSMGSGLAYLTDRGNSAEVAATRMTMGISMMTTPSKQAATLLEGLGVASSDVTASSSAMTTVLQKTGITQNKLATDLKQPDGLYVALKDLQDGLKKAGVSGTEADSVLAKIFGGGRSDKAIMSLMQNLDGLKQKYDAISTDSTTQKFEQNWEDAKKNFGFQMTQIVDGLKNAGIAVGAYLIPKLSAFISFVQTTLGPVVAAAKKDLSEFLDGLSGVGGGSGFQQLGVVVRGIATDIGSFAKNAIQAFKNLWVAVGPAAKVIGVEFLGALKVAGSFLANVVGPALVAVSGFFRDHQTIVMALVQLALIPLAAKMIALPFKLVTSAATSFFGVFKAGYQSVQDSVTIIKNFANGIASAGKSALGFASDVKGGMTGAEDAAGTFGGKIGTIFKGIGSVASSTWSGISTAASATWSAISSAASVTASGISTAWSGISGFFGSIFTTIGSAARAFGAVLLETVFPALVDAAAATWTFTVALLANPITWIVLAVIALGVGVYELITHWKAVSAFFSGLWKVIKAVFSDAINFVVGIIKGWYPLILGILTGGVLLIPALIFKYWNKIGPWLKSIWDTCVKDVEGFGNAVKQKWDTMVQDVENWIQNIGQKITSFFSSLPGKIGSWLSNTANTIRQEFDSVVQGCEQWLSNMGSRIGSWFGALPGIISRFFSGAYQWLVGAGEAILTGLLNGLISIWNHITSFVGSIGSWIASHKGPIEYDRTLLTPHGNAIMQGLLGGLQQGGKQVTAYLDQFTQGIGGVGAGGLTGTINVAGSPMAPVAGAGAGGSGTTINVYVSAPNMVATEQQLIRSVQAGILKISGQNSGFGTTPAFA